MAIITYYTEKQIADAMIKWYTAYSEDVEAGQAAAHGEFSPQEVADYFLQLLKEGG